MIVQKKTYKMKKSFKTQSGFELKEPIVAYEEYTEDVNLPVVIILHGGLSSPHMAGKYNTNDSQAGYWDLIIGEDKVFNTKKYRVICPNSLGSMYGTTGPNTINPDTNKIYGADFPSISMIDMVQFLKQFLDELDIKQLHLVAGVSMGAMHALQLSVLYPEFCKAVVSIATAGRMTPSGMCMHHFMINTLKMDPDFNGGNYIQQPKIGLKIIHQIIPIYYTHETIITKLCWSDESQNKRSENCN